MIIGAVFGSVAGIIVAAGIAVGMFFLAKQLKKWNAKRADTSKSEFELHKLEATDIKDDS